MRHISLRPLKLAYPSAINVSHWKRKKSVSYPGSPGRRDSSTGSSSTLRLLRKKNIFLLFFGGGGFFLKHFLLRYSFLPDPKIWVNFTEFSKLNRSEKFVGKKNQFSPPFSLIPFICFACAHFLQRNLRSPIYLMYLVLTLQLEVLGHALLCVLGHNPDNNNKICK